MGPGTVNRAEPETNDGNPGLLAGIVTFFTIYLNL
jgi:hypothetical protein